MISLLCYADVDVQYIVVSMGNYFLKPFHLLSLFYFAKHSFKTVENHAGSLCSSRFLYFRSSSAPICKFLINLHLLLLPLSYFHIC